MFIDMCPVLCIENLSVAGVDTDCVVDVCL